MNEENCLQGLGRGEVVNGWAAFKIAKKLQAIKLKAKEWNMLAFGDINPKEWNMLAFGDINVKLLEAEKWLHEWDLLGESRSLTADENYWGVKTRVEFWRCSKMAKCLKCIRKQYQESTG